MGIVPFSKKEVNIIAQMKRSVAQMNTAIARLSIFGKILRVVIAHLTMAFAQITKLIA